MRYTLKKVRRKKIDKNSCKFMCRELIRGIISRITPVNNNLTFVRLNPIDEEWESLRFPFYGTVFDKILGKSVDVRTQKFGFLLLGELEQSITWAGNMAEYAKTVSVPYSKIRVIDRDYLREYGFIPGITLVQKGYLEQDLDFHL